MSTMNTPGTILSLKCVVSLHNWASLSAEQTQNVKNKHFFFNPNNGSSFISTQRLPNSHFYQHFMSRFSAHFFVLYYSYMPYTVEQICRKVSFKPALSNPFATRHMWRMALYQNTSKVGYFRLNRTKIKIFPYNAHFKTFYEKKMANEVIIVKTLEHISHKRSFLLYLKIWRTQKYCWTSLF